MKIETLIEELQKLKEEGYTEVMIKKTKYYEEIEDYGFDYEDEFDDEEEEEDDEWDE